MTIGSREPLLQLHVMQLHVKTIRYMSQLDMKRRIYSGQMHLTTSL